MKNFLVVIASLISVSSAYSADIDATQAELDRKCEAARQIALAPLRQEAFEECLAKGKEEPVCKSESAEYNGARADRGPMFYDIPECEAAFNHRKNDDG